MGNSNYLGAVALVCGISTLALAHLDGSTRKKQIYYCVLVVIVLVGASSITSLISFAAAVGAYFYINTFKYPNRARYTLIIALFSTSLLFGVLLGIYWEEFLGSLGRDATASGRSIIWFGAIDLIKDKAFFGYGLGANTLNTSVVNWATHFHNGYLQIAVTTGMTGLTIFMLFLIKLITNVFSELNRPTTRVVILMLFPFIVYNLAEVPMFLYRNPVWILFVYLLMVFVNYPKITRRGNQRSD